MCIPINNTTGRINDSSALLKDEDVDDFNGCSLLVLILLVS